MHRARVKIAVDVNTTTTNHLVRNYRVSCLNALDILRPGADAMVMSEILEGLDNNLPCHSI